MLGHGLAATHGFELGRNADASPCELETTRGACSDKPFLFLGRAMAMRVRNPAGGEWVVRCCAQAPTRGVRCVLEEAKRADAKRLRRYGV